MQCRLILCGIVGGLEMNPKDVAKLVPGAIDVEGSINVHSPVLEMIDWDRGLHISPLSDEISERL
jgi:hypothetical protein